METNKFCLKFIVGFFFLSFFFTNNANAQFTDLVDESQKQVLPDSSKTYFIPDASEKKMRWSKRDFKFMTLKLGFAPIIDYNWVIQNDESVGQVGDQESRFDIRSARVMFKGKLNFKNPWSYLIGVEYRGEDRPEGQDPFGFTDFRVVIPAGKQAEVSVGKIKETFIYEYVGDAANLPHFERWLNPFAVTRNIGVTYKHFFLDDRMTVTGGWFNGWLTNDLNFSESANTFTGRITALPKWYNDGKQFIHMGLGLRYTEAVDGMVRLKGKNESSISSNYVDTGDFPADDLINLSVEQLWSLDNFSFLLEYVHSWVDTPEGYEQFKGYYLTTSYVISGDTRPYDKRSAYARRVMPDGKYGALEVVGRIGKINLDSGDINGGINDRIDLGLNWWATQYWKAGIIWGLGHLERFDTMGVTNNIQMRIQWIY